MLRLTPASICPFCEISSLYKALHPSWQQSRTAATLQKQRPSRMLLSPTVRRGPPKDAVQDKPIRKSRNSPWAGTNVTEVPKDLRPARNQIASGEETRQSRHSKGTTKADKRRSRDPMKALKMQQALANISYERRGRTKQTISERDQFEDFELLPVISHSIPMQALNGMVDVSPTPIQRLAIPALLGNDGKRSSRPSIGTTAGEMQQFLLAAETGSGKTLAYVLPIIDAIKRAEAAEKDDEPVKRRPSTPQDELRALSSNKAFDVEPPTPDEPDSSTARPRAIILVPTSELVEQVGRLIKSLAHTIKYRAALISADYTGKVIRSRLFTTAGIDVVVCTPHLLSSITESDPNILSRVSHLVVDEADSLLDRSFSPITSSIIDRATPSLQQLIFCSATIPRSLDSYLSKRYPDVRRLVTPNLHAIPRRVQLSVVDIDKIPYQGNRDLTCAQVIWDIGKEMPEQGETREKKVLVFVNEREKATELADYLRKKGIDATALSRDSDDRKTSDILASFTGMDTTASRSTNKPTKTTADLAAISPGDLTIQSPPSRTSNTRSLSGTKVLVTTDISSRGIDTLPVRHVILYDVPHTSIDFIHRLGRVGRMNRRGRGIVLVGRKDRKDVVKEIRDAMFKGTALI